MVRISRLTDYGIVLLSHLAGAPARAQSAAELALELQLPLPTVSKLLGMLSKAGLLESHRGSKGGYSLATAPEKVSIARVVEALEGPVALTMCSGDLPGDCEYQSLCPLPGHWKKINGAIRDALEAISLADVGAPTPRRPADGRDAQERPAAPR